MAADGSYIQRCPGDDLPRHFQQRLMARYR
jgi:hypothetical protein